MLAVTPSALTAAKSSSKRPALSFRLRNRTIAAVHRIMPWSTVYSGSEAAGASDTVLTDAGTAVTVRSDTTTVYVRRVPNAATATAWSTWSTLATGVVSGSPVAVACYGRSLAVFYNSAANTISYHTSADDGATWSAAITGLALGAAIQRLAASARGDAAGNFAGGVLIAVVGGPDVRAISIDALWGLSASSTGWGASATAVSGVDVTYRHDFEVIVTGSTAAGEFAWGLVWGIGVQTAANTWSARWDLDQTVSTVATYSNPTIETIDGTVHFGYEENRTTTVARRYYLLAHCPTMALSTGRWIDGETSEPLISHATSASSNQFRLAANATTALMVDRASVRRSSYGESQTLTETSIQKFAAEFSPERELAQITIDNDTPIVAAALLQPGVEVTIGWGYDGTITTYAALELESVEYAPKGRVLTARGIPEALGRHRVRQARAYAAGAKTIQQLINLVAARAGVAGAYGTGASSTVMSTAQPPFTLRPGERSSTALDRLIATVPELAYNSTGRIALTDPTGAETPAYTLGTDHEILNSTHTVNRPKTTRALATSKTGFDEVTSSSYGHLVADAVVDDQAGSSAALLTAIATRFTRHGDMSAAAGWVEIHPHPGLQISDVVQIEDTRAGISGPRRIRGVAVRYDGLQWIERLTLSGR